MESQECLEGTPLDEPKPNHQYDYQDGVDKEQRHENRPAPEASARKEHQAYRGAKADGYIEIREFCEIGGRIYRASDYDG
jgi:hypothetical protein